MQIRSKKLLTNQKSKIPKIYSYIFSLSLLLSTSLSLSSYSPPLSLSQMTIVCKNIVLNLNIFSNTMFIDYYDIVGLNLFSELKVFKKLQIKEYTPIGILNYIKKSQIHFQIHALLINFTNNTYYSYLCKKKFFKIKINKIISKIDNVSRKIK